MLDNIIQYNNTFIFGVDNEPINYSRIKNDKTVLRENFSYVPATVGKNEKIVCTYL